MTVCVDLCAEGKEELDSLAGLSSDRERIVPLPICLRFEGWKALQVAVRRLGGDAYETVKKERLHAPASLDPISVDGGLFLSLEKTLCYYHRVAVAGTLFDKIMIPLNRSLCDKTIELIGDELKRRRNGGNSRSWDEFRLQFLTQLRPGTPENPATAGKQDVHSPEQERFLLVCLDETSLRLLLKPAAGNELLVSRKGGKFSAVVPVSPSDCGQTRIFLDLAKDNAALIGRFAGSERDWNLLVALQPLIPSLTAREEADGRLALSGSLDGFTDLTPKAIRDAKPIADWRIDYDNSVASMRGREMPINEGLTLDKVLDRFKKPGGQVPSATVPVAKPESKTARPEYWCYDIRRKPTNPLATNARKG